MNVIHRSALVAYTPRQMFELVNAIEEYPRFLPWCRTSRVIERSDREVEAELEIAWSGVHKSFTTRNKLYPYEHMEITLVNGPFRHLTGKWSFIALGDQGCKVSLDLEFEFAGHFFDRLFQPIFNSIGNSLVDVFCKRAVEIYGHS